MTPSDFYSVLGEDVVSKAELKNELIKKFPAKTALIGQAFDRY